MKTTLGNNRKVMKKHIIIVSAVIAVAATACSKDNGSYVQTKEIKVSVGNVAASDGTKAVFTDREGMSWETEDAQRLGIIAGSGENWSSAASKSISINEDKTATFAADVAQDASAAWFYYPYGGSDNGLKHSFNFPAELVQSKAGVSENFRFVSKQVAVLDGGKIEPAFKMAGSMVRTVIYSAAGMEEKVQSVKLIAKTANLSSTECTYDFESSSLTAGGTCTSAVKVKLAEKYDLTGKTGKENASAVYLPVVPANTEGFTIEVATDIAFYTFDSSSAKEWADGQLYTLYTNLDKGSRETREIIFHWGGASGSNYKDVINFSADAVTYGNGIPDPKWVSLYHSVNGEINDSTNRFADDSGIMACIVVEKSENSDWLTFSNNYANHFNAGLDKNDTGEERTATVTGRLDKEKFAQLFPQYADYHIQDPLFTVTFVQSAN